MNRQVSLFHYIRQAIYASVFLWCVLLVMDVYEGKQGLVWVVGTSSLTSSAYIVFTRPYYHMSHSIHLIGSYVLNIIVGVACSYIILLSWHHTGLPYVRVVEIVTAFAVGISLLLQTILNLQHPPAAGLSLILASDSEWHVGTILIILMAVLTLALIARILQEHIKKLES